MNHRTINPSYPSEYTQVSNVSRSVVDRLAATLCSVPSINSLMNSGPGVPYTLRVGTDQGPMFDQGDKIKPLKGYFSFNQQAMLYFFPLSRDPNFDPPDAEFMKFMAENTDLPMVVEKDDAGVYREIPHMVVARFAVSGNELVVDANNAPVIELITLCCDTNLDRFDQRSHLKEVDGTMTLYAGVIVQDWSKVSWNGYTNTAADTTGSHLQLRWIEANTGCRAQMNEVENQGECEARMTAN
jgi:hypothetical protein